VQPPPPFFLSELRIQNCSGGTASVSLPGADVDTVKWIGPRDFSVQLLTFPLPLSDLSCGVFTKLAQRWCGNDCLQEYDNRQSERNIPKFARTYCRWLYLGRYRQQSPHRKSISCYQTPRSKVAEGNKLHFKLLWSAIAYVRVELCENGYNVLIICIGKYLYMPFMAAITSGTVMCVDSVWEHACFVYVALFPVSSKPVN